MTPSYPIFSIVIPTYNRAHLIAKTIESVLNQSFVEFEVMVIDDGSTDNTEGVVKTFTDPRVSYHRKQNAERGAARNYGAAKANGLYVNFIDSDDLVYPNHLRVAHSLILRDGNPEFFHLGYDYKLDDGTLLHRVDNFSERTRDTVLFDNKLSCNGVFLRKDVIKEYPFEENRVLASSEDWALWITLICRYKLRFSNEITSSVINHDQRSLRTIAVEKIVARDLFFVEKLRQDSTVMKTYGKKFNRFIAMRYTFFMLGYSEQRNPREVLKWAVRAFQVFPQILIDRRFLASLKNSLFK
jgi:glycosyltransferase involved in cell wall biosynthesis